MRYTIDQEVRVGLTAKTNEPFRMEALDQDLNAPTVLMDTNAPRSEAVTVPASTRMLVITGTGFADITFIHD